jgi:serine/threonine protein kinase
LFELRRKLSGKRPAEILSIIRRVFQQLLQGLKVLSGLNIVHADIKPQNIIVSDDDEYQVHLIDFGSSIIIEGLRVNDRNIGGTFAYCPPDMFLGKRLTHKSDVWTLALTISELLFQKEQSATLIAPLIKSEMNPQGFLKKRLDFLGPPSQSRSPNIYDSVPFKLAFKEWKTLRGNAKSFASLNSKYSKEYQLSSATEYKSLIRLLETLLDWDRDERPTAEEALKHEFFRPTKHQNSF